MAQTLYDAGPSISSLTYENEAHLLGKFCLLFGDPLATNIACKLLTKNLFRRYVDSKDQDEYLLDLEFNTQIYTHIGGVLINAGQQSNDLALRIRGQAMLFFIADRLCRNSMPVNTLEAFNIKKVLNCNCPIYPSNTESLNFGLEMFAELEKRGQVDPNGNIETEDDVTRVMAGFMLFLYSKKRDYEKIAENSKKGYLARMVSSNPSNLIFTDDISIKRLQKAMLLVNSDDIELKQKFRMWIEGLVAPEGLDNIQLESKEANFNFLCVGLQKYLVNTVNSAWRMWNSMLKFRNVPGNYSDYNRAINRSKGVLHMQMRAIDKKGFAATYENCSKKLDLMLGHKV